MKSIDEIKKGLAVCAADVADGICWDKGCPYSDDDDCQTHIAQDALEAIENLEERIAIMEEGGETIVWHKWPDEVPEQYVSVLGRMADMDKRLPQVRECYLTQTGRFCFPALVGDDFHDIAEWAYMPAGRSEA